MMQKGNESGINCPRDGARAWLLEVRGPWGNVEVDFCPECEHLWFDGGELESTLDSRTLWAMMLRECWSDVGHACPRCRAPMVVAFAFSVVEEICRHCRGIWIARRDLELLSSNILERVRSLSAIEHEVPRRPPNAAITHLATRLRRLMRRNPTRPGKPRAASGRARPAKNAS